MTCNYEISVPDRSISVNRTTLVLYRQGRISLLMFSLQFHQFAAATFGLFLLCQPVSAQSKKKTSAQPSTTEAVSIDPKRAQKAIERGEKAEAEGRVEQALAAYDEAARYAPNDPVIVGRGAALRSKLVREHVEAAERLALDGHLTQAVDALNNALLIDKGNTIVAQRLLEMKAMAEEDAPAPSTQAAAGLPQLKPEPGRKNVSFRGDVKAVYQQLAS